MSPLTLPDLAVLGALHTAGESLSAGAIAAAVAKPASSSPGMHLTISAVSRITARLRARDLISATGGGIGQRWYLTERGRVLWAAKGSRFTL
ncbi:hypothetical protein D7D52_27000 [Nocardia yunnanensis]|uniref:MarR family transcriptional regulator n=1 Tax=Nocardia yunnanensis TaxID=2382165 RepID=A0A386ZG24_9NOCA|nr:hypothetical protein [Nocardia yunnanensis]AYF76852.1 hypothetical protein D7D52_27000 [Nocardia yunnanensis]